MEKETETELIEKEQNTSLSFIKESKDEEQDSTEDFGIYQILHFLSVLLGMSAAAPVLFSLYYFSIYPEDLLCLEDGFYTSCTKEYICSSRTPVQYLIDYKSGGENQHNWIQQYDLLCATQFQISAIGSSFFLGNFLGSLVLPRLGDIYGRKPLFQFGLVLQNITYLGLLQASKIELLYIMLVLGGISKTCTSDVGYIYAIEIMPKRLRNLSGLLIFVLFAVIKVNVCLYFWLSQSKNWKVPAIAALTMSVASSLTTVFLLESPRFLIGSKRFDEAEQVLSSIHRINHKKEPKHIIISRDTFESNNENYVSGKTSQIAVNNSFSDLWQIKNLRINLIVMMITWSFASFAFFMVPFYLKNVKGNFYHLTLASESAELAAAIICAYSQRVISLQKSMITSCAFIIFGGVCLTFINQYYSDANESYLACVFILITNFGVVAFFDLAFLIVPELFPTALLSTAYGCCNVVGRLVTVGSPIVADMQQPTPIVLVIMLAALCCQLIQNTKKI